MAQFPLQVKCYDLSRGFAKIMAGPLLNSQVEAIWHTSVLCHGMEWFYGGGIQYAAPIQVENSYGLKPIKILDLPNTSKTLKEIEQWCRDHMEEFSEDNYDLLRHNCNHFTDTLAKFLTDGKEGLPLDIRDQHESIASTQRGSFIINMLEKFMNQMKNVAAQDGLAGFIRTGRPSATLQSMEPSWTSHPNEFELEVKKMWNDPTADRAKITHALKRFYLMADNVVKHATDPKYLTVQASNPRLQECILSVPHGEACLIKLGFVKRTSIYTLGDNVDRAILTRLYAATKLLEPIKNSHEQPADSNSGVPQPSASPATEYAFQLNQLKDFGFLDEEANIR